MQSTRERLLATDFPAIVRDRLSTLQVNLGYTCNLSCSHCHVNAGPSRTEQMDRGTVEQVLEVLASRGIAQLDLTGGAPEMNPHFRYLVERAGALGVTVIDRCNLTILEEPGYEWLASFLAEQRVTIVASLPCYAEENVAAQRGRGVFETSIRSLQLLNALGYGRGELQLNLVYNPNGAFLPPAQEKLERDYKAALGSQYGIVFDKLYTLTNMPISRFGAVLLAKGELDSYLQLLRENYAPQNLEGLMCKSTVSVDWRGMLYDCDFNQMLDLPALHPDPELIVGRRGLHVSDLLQFDLSAGDIVRGEHCYGCTAGQGSSCGGALS
jgi:radical SAM/Cys-rich protein